MIDPGGRVAGVDVEDSRFYLDAPLETLPDATQNSALKVAASTPGEHLFQALRQSGFSYIFARRGAVKDPPGWCPYVKPDFLKKFTTLVFSDGKTVVYRLNN